MKNITIQNIGYDAVEKKFEIEYTEDETKKWHFIKIKRCDVRTIVEVLKDTEKETKDTLSVQKNSKTRHECTQ